MFGKFDSFEKQFRWEEDRWIFRFRQRGAPVEVSDLERERLVARHQSRRRTALRLFVASVFASALLLALLPGGAVPTWMLAVCFYGSAMVIGMTLDFWCDQAVTAHLRRRIPAGERLGWLGQWKMRAEVTPWWQIGLALASAAMAAWLVAMPLPEWNPVTRTIAAVLVVIVGAGLVFLAIMKWTIDHNRELGDDWKDDLDDARDLRGE